MASSLVSTAACLTTCTVSPIVVLACTYLSICGVVLWGLSHSLGWNHIKHGGLGAQVGRGASPLISGIGNIPGRRLPMA